MKTFATAAAALFMLTSAGAVMAQNNNDGTAGNGGATGQSNCPEGYETMAQDQLSEKCKAEISQMNSGSTTSTDSTGSVTEAPGAGNTNSVEQPPEGSNSSSTSQ